MAHFFRFLLGLIEPELDQPREKKRPADSLPSNDRLERALRKGETVQPEDWPT